MRPNDAYLPRSSNIKIERSSSLLLRAEGVTDVVMGRDLEIRAELLAAADAADIDVEPPFESEPLSLETSVTSAIC